VLSGQNVILGLTLKQLLAIVIPIFLIQEGIVIAALFNLKNLDNSQVQGNKTLWAVLLIISIFSMPLGLIIAIVYFVVGRKPYASD
jgi:hypothetical protein